MLIFASILLVYVPESTFPTSLTDTDAADDTDGNIDDGTADDAFDNGNNNGGGNDTDDRILLPSFSFLGTKLTVTFFISFGLFNLNNESGADTKNVATVNGSVLLVCLLVIECECSFRMTTRVYLFS
mmetsp:Transcript_30741/g.34370  ORF Transcript_30741/g.34370 Transcript_30741/m.34370 type:complete len:127 (+) Transcript_30741:146-526(+)